VETLQVTEAQNVFLPAPTTSQAPFVFVGETQDSLIGQLSAAWATQWALGGENVRFYNDELIGIDSVVLDVFIASSYGDIGTPLRLSVQQLTQPLSSAQSYTTDAVFMTDGRELSLAGRDTIRYSTFSPRVWRVGLDTALGRQILTLPAAALTNQSAFVNAFPGLLIRAYPFTPMANGAIYTVLVRSPQTALRIYYRERIQGRVVPQQYAFLVTDTCVWAYNLRRQSGGSTLRDSLERDVGLQQTKLLLAGGLSVGVRLKISGWDRLSRGLVLGARWILPPATGYEGNYSAFYPRLSGIACYADTMAEAASAAWGLGDFVGDSAFIDVTVPMQEVLVGVRPRPNYWYVWPVGRQYALKRWVMSGIGSPRKPYLVVILARP
jgi:hypothetical protein